MGFNLKWDMWAEANLFAIDLYCAYLILVYFYTPSSSIARFV